MARDIELGRMGSEEQKAPEAPLPQPHHQPQQPAAAAAVAAAAALDTAAVPTAAVSLGIGSSSGGAGGVVVAQAAELLPSSTAIVTRQAKGGEPEVLLFGDWLRTEATLSRDDAGGEITVTLTSIAHTGLTLPPGTSIRVKINPQQLLGLP